MNQSVTDQVTPFMPETVPPIQPDANIPSTKRPFSRLWLIAGGVVVVGLIALVVINKILNTTPKPPAVQVIETPTPTPTPVRMLSSIASQSAFVALEQTHASLSAGLTGTNLDDPSLSPPVLDLPLGFRQ